MPSEGLQAGFRKVREVTTQLVRRQVLKPVNTTKPFMIGP